MLITLDNDSGSKLRRNLVDYDTNVVSDDQTLIVLDDTTVPGAATVESQPAEEVFKKTTVSYTLQSRSADGRAIDDANDIYRVTLICLYEDEERKKKCRKDLYSAIAVHQGSGVYIADIHVSKQGVYDVLITMNNAYTTANPNVSTAVAGSRLRVVKEPKSEKLSKSGKSSKSEKSGKSESEKSEKSDKGKKDKSDKSDKKEKKDKKSKKSKGKGKKM